MLEDIHIGIAIIAGLSAFWVVGDAVYQYRTTPGTSYLTAFSGSLTIFWARFKILCAALVAFMASAAGYLGLPQVQQFLQTNLSPSTVAMLIAASAVVSEMARRRTLPKD